jgi:hypothetical protein
MMKHSGPLPDTFCSCVADYAAKLQQSSQRCSKSGTTRLRPARSSLGLELNLGADLQKPSTRRIWNRLINFVASTVKWPVPYSTKFKVFGAIHCHGCGSIPGLTEPRHLPVAQSYSLCQPARRTHRWNRRSFCRRHRPLSKNQEPKG